MSKRSRLEDAADSAQRKHLANALHALEQLEKHVASVRRCVEGGSFPMYLSDLAVRAGDVIIFATAFNALASAKQEAALARAHAAGKRKKRAG